MKKEKPKLTEDEKVILRNLSKKYKWIARTGNGNLYIYQDKYAIAGKSLDFFSHLFKSINIWEDEEPYLISDLLEEDN